MSDKAIEDAIARLAAIPGIEQVHLADLNRLNQAILDSAAKCLVSEVLHDFFALACIKEALTKKVAGEENFIEMVDAFTDIRIMLAMEAVAKMKIAAPNVR